MSEPRSPYLALGLTIVGSLATNFLTGYLGVSIAVGKIEVRQENTQQRVVAAEILIKQQEDKYFQLWKEIFDLRERLTKHEAQNQPNPRSVP